MLIKEHKMSVVRLSENKKALDKYNRNLHR